MPCSSMVVPVSRQVCRGGVVVNSEDAEVPLQWWGHAYWFHLLNNATFSLESYPPQRHPYCSAFEFREVPSAEVISQRFPFPNHADAQSLFCLLLCSRIIEECRQWEKLRPSLNKTSQPYASFAPFMRPSLHCSWWFRCRLVFEYPVFDSHLLPVQLIACTPTSAGILFNDPEFHKVIYLPEGCGSAEGRIEYARVAAYKPSPQQCRGDDDWSIGELERGRSYFLTAMLSRWMTSS